MFKMTLRELLLLTTLVATGLGWWSQWSEAERGHETLIAAYIKRGNELRAELAEEKRKRAYYEGGYKRRLEQKRRTNAVTTGTLSQTDSGDGKVYDTLGPSEDIPEVFGQTP